MAKFIGSNIETGNWGEDFLVKTLQQFFDDDCIIYRNREIFGTQFDVCLMIPNQGIVIFEVKGWRPDTILRVKNGDSIIIKSKDPNGCVVGEDSANPTAQARGYMFSMINRIRQKVGKVPFVFSLVCFPQIARDDYDKKGLAPVCEIETTILKEDMASKSAFYAKINLAMKNGQRRINYCNPFTPELMFRTRQLFESDLDLKDVPIKKENRVTETCSSIKDAYSLFVYLPADISAENSIWSEISNAYASGCKIYMVTQSQVHLCHLASCIDTVLQQKGLGRSGANLKFQLSSPKSNSDQSITDTFFAFNCTAVTSQKINDTIPLFRVYDGITKSSTERHWLETIGQNSQFNYEQYQVEHADSQKNIMIRAGAGTGKTYTMISRIGFICHSQNCSVRNMADRIVMITFTNEAADQMERKIKEYFDNYYLLTGNTDYLAFISQIDNMQISTIHSYAKKLIELLGMEFGYGVDLRVTSSEYRRKQIVSDLLDAYLQEKVSLHGDSYTRNLGMPIYAIKDNVLSFINRLHNQSVDVSQIKSADFGDLESNADDHGKELHELLAYIIPAVEAQYSKDLLEDNRIHLSTMMSTLNKCLCNPVNIERLRSLQTGKPQFMFVDEFQDTDDIQIHALLEIARLLEYRLFVVGDIKQCIYRFRGAKEKAFDQLHIEKKPTEWQSYSLMKNYRTDSRLLDLFDHSFSAWANQGNEDPLLVYNQAEDRLIGTGRYNDGLVDGQFYKPIHISQDSERMAALFLEVERQKKRILYEEGKGQHLSSKNHEIAILVRENWQADLIRKEGKSRGVAVFTNTGGDLYQSAPALDMQIMVNALLHYDEADYLFAFASSNFFAGGANKATMQNIRNDIQGGWKKKVDESEQAIVLQNLIDANLVGGQKECSWSSIIASLRTRPLLQVIRELYGRLKPWISYGANDLWKQNYYRMNVDLLFEELISACNTNTLTINTLSNYLSSSIMSCKNVDSRVPEEKVDDIIVRCVTIHKAKGLEYGAVILPFCSAAINVMKRANLHTFVKMEHGQYQIGYQLKLASGEKIRNSYFSEQTEKDERKREETRILYVAMTRAIRSFSWIIDDSKKTESWQQLIFDGVTNNAI